VSRLLLDTHVFLWWQAADRRLPRRVQTAIESADMVFVSVASAWECSIKVALGKLRIPGSFEDAVEKSGFEKLLISFAHAHAAGRLPPHHSDPFDRMLIAQAAAETLVVVTHDRQFAAYGVRVLWA
jgi:PIN domain nuclease of toxin-antitoxin system